MKTDISNLREKIIEEARLSYRENTEPGEDEITAAALGKELGCTAKKAYHTLQALVAAGKATMPKNGPRGCNVYKMK